MYRVVISDNSLFPYENYTSGWIGDDNWVTPQLPDGRWYWRVKARDNAGNEGGNSPTRWFEVDTTPPSGVTLVSPDNENTRSENSLWLDWTTGTDNHGPVLYRLLVSTYENFASTILDTGWVDNDNWYLEDLIDNRYYWKVQARDEAGNVFENEVRWFIVENTPPTTPRAVQLAIPSSEYAF